MEFSACYETRRGRGTKLVCELCPMKEVWSRGKKEVRQEGQRGDRTMAEEARRSGATALTAARRSKHIPS
eukprot:768646-Hanusia_phi.AAC.14